MALDEADKKTIGDIIAEALKGEAITSAVTGAVKRELGALKLDDLRNEVAGLKKRAEETPAAGAGDDGGKKGKADEGAKGDPAVVAQLTVLRKQLEDEKGARERAEQEAKTDRLLSAARDELVAAGVPAERVKHVLATLHHADGRLRYGENGEPGLHFKRDTYEEIVPLKKGVGEWLKTDDGKSFLPATNVQGTGGGSGNPNGGPPIRTGGKLDMGALKERLAGALAKTDISN